MHRALLLILCIGISYTTAPGQEPRQSRDRESINKDQGEFVPSLPAGADIPVRVAHTMDIKQGSAGKVYSGTVAEDVIGSDGRLVVPRGAEAQLIAKKLPDDNMTIDLQSLTVEGHRYVVDAAEYRRPPAVGIGIHNPSASSTDDALFGTIVGTVSPDKQGAKNSPLTPAAGPLPTRGRTVNIPAHTVLKFRLNHAMELGHGR